jgi:ribosomal protein L3 glutamine methyltransferase
VTRLNQSNAFFGHGTDNSYDEAISIVLHCISIDHSIADNFINCALLAEEKTQIIDLLEKRITSSTPLPYLTHQANFCGLSFYIDERVLIPRSPIAELIENAFDPWIQYEQVTHILDLCCGSGCIGIACTYAFEEASIDLVELSPDAINVANINIKQHKRQNQARIIESDLFSNLPNKQYDIIVSNPPYVHAEDMSNLPDEYRKEPQMALEAGNDGLILVDKILSQAKQYLSPHGILVVEVGNSMENLINKYPDTPFTWVEFERGGHGVFLLTAEQLLMRQQ